MRRAWNELLVVAMALVIVGVTGCSSQNVASLEGSWQLVSLGGPNNPQPIIEDTEVTAVFTEEAEPLTGRVVGTAGCNQYFANFEIRGDKITIGPLAQTEMFCMAPEGVMDQEKQFLTALGAAGQFKVEDNELRIVYSDGKVLAFSRLDK